MARAEIQYRGDDMKMAIRLSGFDPTPVPYQTEGAAVFPDKESADKMCKNINDDPKFGPYRWTVQGKEFNGKNCWMIVSDSHETGEETGKP